MLQAEIFHLGVHILTLAVSVVVLAISASAYLRERRKRFLYVCVAFAFLAARSALTLVDSGVGLIPDESLLMLPAIDISVSHLSDLVVVSLFAAAVLLREREVSSDVR